jgi:hypothetical protein
MGRSKELMAWEVSSKFNLSPASPQYPIFHPRSLWNFRENPSAVSGPEVRALEGGFGGTYNDLQGSFCDDQQRKVGRTAFQLISARRLQQRRTATTSSSFKLRVTYELM